MCGIQFVVNGNSYSNKTEEFLTDAFIANQVRGMDSSGVFQVDSKFNKNGTRDVCFFKKACHGSDFIGYSAAKEILAASSRKPITVGHVRAATAGNVTHENAHPFVAIRPDGSRIIGVHNGSLQGWADNEGADDHEVDSAWLFNKLAKDGIAAFEGFNGAFALVWFDSLHPNSLFIARNDKRTLYYGYSEGDKVMFGASELGMLGWLMERNDIKVAKNANDIRFFYPEAGFVHEVDINNPRKIEKTPFATYDYTKKKYSKPVPVGQVIHTQHRPVDLRPNTPPNTSTVDAWAASDMRRQVSQLKAIKDALAETRSSRILAKKNDEAKDPLVVDAEDLELAMHAELKRWSDRTDPTAPGYVDPIASNAPNKGQPRENFVFELDPNDAACTVSEKQRATHIGMRGLRVRFVGYFHDDETSTAFGDFRTVEDGEEVVYDAMVRNITGRAAELKYISPRSTTDMVVIGITAPEKANNGKPFIILTDSNPKATTTTIYNAKDMYEARVNQMLH
jgi:hypothetical protein